MRKVLLKIMEYELSDQEEKKLKWHKILEEVEYKQGQEDFKNKTFENTNVKYSWYKTTVPTKKWNSYYSTIGSYTYLGGDKEQTSIGFLSVGCPDQCLEITNGQELGLIDNHRHSTNQRPYVF